MLWYTLESSIDQLGARLSPVQYKTARHFYRLLHCYVAVYIPPPGMNIIPAMWNRPCGGCGLVPCLFRYTILVNLPRGGRLRIAKSLWSVHLISLPFSSRHTWQRVSCSSLNASSVSGSCLWGYTKPQFGRNTYPIYSNHQLEEPVNKHSVGNGCRDDA